MRSNPASDLLLHVYNRVPYCGPTVVQLLNHLSESIFLLFGYTFIFRKCCVSPDTFTNAPILLDVRIPSNPGINLKLRNWGFANQGETPMFEQPRFSN